MNIRSFGAQLLALLVACVALSSPAGAQSTQPDVLVVGGTPAGVAAAVAAARRGKSVELVVQRAHLGGILTDGMMDQWDLNLARDGQPIQAGIFTEIYARLGDSFTPAQAAQTFDALAAAEPHIHVVTGAVASTVQTARTNGETRVRAITFRAISSGRTFSVGAAYVIDATDDGDVAALAGARYDLGRQDTGRDERMQPVTLMFTVTGVDWSRMEAAYDPVVDGFGGVTQARAWGFANVLRGYAPSAPNIIVDDLNLGHENGGSITVNAIDVLGIDGRSPTDLARARGATEREAPRLVAWLNSRIHGFEQARVGRYADAIYVRETRHFAGIERLTSDAVWAGSIPADTIGLSSYPLDLHPVVPGDKPAFAPIRHVYGVPFGSLVPLGFGNLVLASPAISASHLASGSARVIPTTIEEGEAAGAAAALAAGHQLSFAALARDRGEIRALRADLAHSGVFLAPSIAKAGAPLATARRRKRSAVQRDPVLALTRRRTKMPSQVRARASAGSRFHHKLARGDRNRWPVVTADGCRHERQARRFLDLARNMTEKRPHQPDRMRSVNTESCGIPRIDASHGNPGPLIKVDPSAASDDALVRSQ